MEHTPNDKSLLAAALLALTVWLFLTVCLALGWPPFSVEMDLPPAT